MLEKKHEKRIYLQQEYLWKHHVIHAETTSVDIGIKLLCKREVLSSNTSFFWMSIRQHIMQRPRYDSAGMQVVQA